MTRCTPSTLLCSRSAGGGCRPSCSTGPRPVPRRCSGPVLIDPPTGEPAVALWRAVTAWLEFPHLYELQRPKRPEDLAEIAEAFRPYLEARDWISMAKETP